MPEKLEDALQANDDIHFYNEYFNKVTFIACHRQIHAGNLDKNELDNDNYFYKDDPHTIIHIRILVTLKNAKHLKKR